MRKKLTEALPFIILLSVDFYLLPFLARETGAAMLLMLCMMPLIAFIASLAYGMRRGFHIILPAVATILFIPTIFIHYNSSAWIYAIIYGAVALAGTGIGAFLHKKS